MMPRSSVEMPGAETSGGQRQIHLLCGDELRRVLSEKGTRIFVDCSRILIGSHDQAGLKA